MYTIDKIGEGSGHMSRRGMGEFSSMYSSSQDMGDTKAYIQAQDTGRCVLVLTYGVCGPCWAHSVASLGGARV